MLSLAEAIYSDARAGVEEVPAELTVSLANQTMEDSRPTIE